MKPLKILHGGANFALNFGNPIQVLWKRRFGRDGMIRLIDRRTGIRCDCTMASHRMFGETWYDHDYDIPQRPLRADDVVLDIGANQGFYTCYAAQQGARVYAFEPTPRSFQTLSHNVQINGLKAAVTAEQWAVAGYDGTVELMTSDQLGGGMNTTQPTFAHQVNLQVQQKITVPCVSLPAILQRYNLEKIRCCKLDCEGSELEILRSLEMEHLEKIESFVIEYHLEAYPMRDLLDLVMNWGTHQVSFAEDKPYTPRQILRLVANSALYDG